jgi:hypothetical protein
MACLKAGSLLRKTNANAALQLKISHIKMKIAGENLILKKATRIFLLFLLIIMSWCLLPVEQKQRLNHSRKTITIITLTLILRMKMQAVNKI